MQDSKSPCLLSAFRSSSHSAAHTSLLYTPGFKKKKKNERKCDDNHGIKAPHFLKTPGAMVCLVGRPRNSPAWGRTGVLFSPAQGAKAAWELKARSQTCGKGEKGRAESRVGSGGRKMFRKMRLARE